uniref:Uncharacterized protein n=1 Tax=Rhizophora mucronata TaxID=61149 RepID=A0A2P2MZ54_RHIMU
MYGLLLILLVLNNMKKKALHSTFMVENVLQYTLKMLYPSSLCLFKNKRMLFVDVTP